jgi:hypothetical protein
VPSFAIEMGQFLSQSGYSKSYILSVCDRRAGLIVGLSLAKAPFLTAMENDLHSRALSGNPR